MYHWSELSKNYPASSIRKMAKLAAQFDDTLMLTMGEPNFETPEVHQKNRTGCDRRKSHALRTECRRALPFSKP
jgi:aspartate/methionine/tyrosine aminotransferase